MSTIELVNPSEHRLAEIPLDVAFWLQVAAAQAADDAEAETADVQELKNELAVAA